MLNSILTASGKRRCLKPFSFMWLRIVLSFYYDASPPVGIGLR